MDSSPKNDNFVIDYSPLCHSKHVRHLFIFRTQIKIFLMKSMDGKDITTINYHNSTDFLKNILICVPKRNKSLTLERYEGESLLTEFSFLGELTL